MLNKTLNIRFIRELKMMRFVKYKIRNAMILKFEDSSTVMSKILEITLSTSRKRETK